MNSDGDLISSVGEERINDCDNVHGSLWSLNSIAVSTESGIGNTQESCRSNAQSEMQMR